MANRDLTEDKNMNISNILIQLFFDKWQMRGLLGFIIGFVPVLAQASDVIKVCTAFFGFILVGISVFKQLVEAKIKLIELEEKRRKLADGE
jgi:hypothetical protein